MSLICSFFGHRDTPLSSEIELRLENTIKNLISQGVYEFWCGNEGTFDTLTRMIMIRLKKDIPYLNLCFVSAYNPDNFPPLKRKTLEENFEIIYSIEIADGHPKFAITRRNKYMINNSDIIVCYITDEKGGAYNAVKLAQKQNKEIINIAL
ncbi:MAG: hypothetical protein IKW39_03470 [Alphaproteobacteria bacterium]|nr:hypothetical protein [Alphaproteobacteria bacterium]